MYHQTPHTRGEQIETLDARKIRARQELLPAKLTSPLTERKQMKNEDTGKKQVSQTTLYPQKAEEPYQVNLDEIPLTEVLKHIKRVSGVQSLYSIQRCIEKFRALQEEKKIREGRGIALRENTGKSKLLGTAGFNNEEFRSENSVNKSEILEAVTQKSKTPIERRLAIRKLRMGQKILSFTQTTKHNTEIPLPKKVIEIELGAGSLANDLTEAERQELKKFVSALRVKIMGGRKKGAKTVLTNNITRAQM